MVKYSQLYKELKKNGCEIYRHGAEHDIWVNASTGKFFAVPRHGSKEVPTGTLRQLRRFAEGKE